MQVDVGTLKQTLLDLPSLGQVLAGRPSPQHCSHAFPAATLAAWAGGGDE